MDQIQVESVCKRFGPHLIFRGVGFRAERGRPVCLWGPNGSGKSTLLKIVAGLIRATEGKVTYNFSGRSGRPSEFRNSIGMCAPDVVMYEELTPVENLEFFAAARGLRRDAGYENELLVRFSLAGVASEPVSTFSSGMRQKFKLICALAHRPSALLLDEPTSYVDVAGRAAIDETVRALIPGSIFVVATNDPAERGWCEDTVELAV